MNCTKQPARVAAAASLALALAAAACGDSPLITNPTEAARPSILPAGTLWVSGTISEATDSGNLPLAGVAVLNWSTSETTATDGAGFYRIGGLHPGLAQLIVAKEGYEERLIEVVIDGDTEVNALLVRQAQPN